MERMLSELVGVVRRAGVRVSTSEAIDLARAVDCVGVASQADLRAAVRSVLVKQPEDLAIVDRALAAFFAADGRTHADLFERLLAQGFSADEIRTLRELLEASARTSPAGPVLDAVARGPLAVDRLIELVTDAVPAARALDPARAGFVAMRVIEAARLPRAETDLGPLRSQLRDGLGARGDRLADVLEDELRNVRRRAREHVMTRAHAQPSRTELDHVPFAALEPHEAREIEQAVQELAQRLIGRALVRARHAARGRIDVRATLRHALTTGGVPFEPVHRGKQPRRPKLVLLCDVSDSVRASARFMLLFVHAVQRLFEDAQSLVFVSDLVDATDVFKREPPARAIELAYGGAIVSVSDNSHYARVFRHMLHAHSDLLTPRTTLVVLGDGRSNHLDPGEAVFRELAERCHRVLWLSPEPESAWRSGDSGLPLYRPHVDAMLPVHDLASLRTAARTLARF